MKRRNFLIALGVVPPLVFSSCGKDEFPSTPTVITGKVIDENNKPVEGFELQFSGYYQKGTSPVPIFDETGKTNNNGIYSISYVVSGGQTTFLPGLNSKFNLVANYDLFVWKDNKYEFVGNPVGPIVYGQTNTFNFQLIKK